VVTFRSVGFTGTRAGMTRAQRDKVKTLLELGYPLEAHHGACIGADAEFHALAGDIKLRRIIHPPIIRTQQMGMADLTSNDKVLPTAEYIERNHAIVDQSDYVIATPGTAHEVRRSGTWATIRYAKAQRKPLVVIFPDGTVEVSPAQGFYVGDLIGTLAT